MNGSGSKARSRSNLRWRADRVSQAFQSAQYTATWPGQPALAQRHRVGFLGCQPHPQLDTDFACNDFEFFDLGGRLHDPFGHAEPDGKVFQISRSGQHHRIRDAVVAECYRRFFRNCARAPRRLAIAPGGAQHAVDRLGQAHFAGTASIRRLRWVSSRYSSCQSLGPLLGVTCTAVTLYSGQLVAQSLYSVVTTLAWVCGWWKVV